MAALNDSIVLLSSMTPKATIVKKTSGRKKVNKLSLKKHFRKSLDFEKSPPRVAQKFAFLPESESTETASTGSVATSKKMPDEAIIISDSNDEDEEEEKEKEAKTGFKCAGLSESRYKIVSNWLKKVKANVKGFDDVGAASQNDDSLFSNLSVIYGEKCHQSSRNGAFNSTFIGGNKCLRFDQLFSTGKDDEKVIYNTRTVKDVKGTSKVVGNVDLHGKVSDRKPKKIVNKINEDQALCNEDVKSIEKGKIREKDSNKLCAAEYTKTPTSTTSPKQTAIEEEHEKLLDELYGHSWRINKEKVLPKTEIKRKQNVPATKRREPQTEKPVRSSAVHKNPYLETEITKSNNLLRRLHSIRLRKMIESPLFGRLRELCDSDTNSEDTEENVRRFPRTRLIFDESDGDKENTGSSAEIKLLEDGLKNRLNFEDKNNKKSEVDIVEASPLVLNDRNRRRNVKSDTSDSDVSVENEQVPKIIRKAKTEVAKKKLPPTQGTTLSFLASLSLNVPVSDCNASARLFRDTYSMYKVQLAQKLFRLYNEKVFDNAIPADTPVEWNDKLRGTAGTCRCRRILRSNGRVEYSVMITLSTKVLDSAERLRDTLIHEMCHAATYLVNKVSEGHGPHWKTWASKAMRTFPELPPIRARHNYKINTKYTYKCIGCGYCVGRHSKSLNTENKRCGFCYGKFELHVNKTTKNGDLQSVPVTPKKEVTGFALFVKDNYANLKTPQRKHKDVMQLLSKKFNELKAQ